MYQILPKSHEVRLEVYNTLVNLYGEFFELKRQNLLITLFLGQKSDLYALEVLWRSLIKQIKMTDRRYYRHVFHRCRHFYRCNNQRIPDELFEYMKNLFEY